MADPNQDTYWRRTRGLMLAVLGLWLVFAIVQVLAISFGGVEVPSLGLPLGFFLAAEASLIAFTAALFVFAHRQDHVDRDHGFDEQV